MEKAHTIFSLPTPLGLDLLLRVLKEAGYLVIGPRVGEHVIELGDIDSIEQLPQGIGDTQEKAFYRLLTRESKTFFGFHLGPQSWKSFLFPAQRTLWRASLGAALEPMRDDLEIDRPLAFLGVRACELAAIQIQDRILRGEGKDPLYTKRRETLLIIGVHCQSATPTCFCDSMGTGPDFPPLGWDLLLTERDDGFLIQSASPLGEGILSSFKLKEAPKEASLWIQSQVENTRSAMVRALPQEGIKETIYQALQSPHWGEVGERCLGCANCTMVCPTCFCSTFIDTLDVTGKVAERKHTWDSCFHLDFTHMHGGSQRVSIASRYRQWFSHKLASWYDQFGLSGCVGCGRCITWCPVGIDITEEMARIRGENNNPDQKHKGELLT